MAAASAAFDGWKKTPIGKRAQHPQRCRRASGSQRRRHRRRTDPREEGKALTLAQRRSHALRPDAALYAVEGQTYGGETYPNDDPDMLVYSQREPLGVVTVISPWNFPVSIPARKIAPALITGNTVCSSPRRTRRSRLPAGRGLRQAPAFRRACSTS